MLSPQEIRNWLNTVDKQGKKLGWADYKAFRNHMLDKITSEDREDILDYLEDYEE